jgi:hypothetical protein
MWEDGSKELDPGINNSCLWWSGFRWVGQRSGWEYFQKVVL